MALTESLEMRAISADGAVFDRFNGAEVVRSIVRPSEFSFELGDETSYLDLAELVATGAEFDVAINGRPMIRGRVYYRESPLDASQSSTLRCVVRTRLADMASGTVDSRIKVQKLSIRDLVLRALAPHGFAEADVDFRGDVSRDVMTGKPARGGKPAKDLAPLKIEAAAPQVGEFTLPFLQRHLRRFGLMIWDGPDGRIVVAEPDDEQDSIYEFRCFRGAEGQSNNLLRVARVEDVTGVPTSLTVFGYGGGLDYQRSKVSSLVSNQPLIDAGFALPGERTVGYRPTVIVDDGVRTAEHARRTAYREFSERTRRSDVVTIETDRYSDADDGAVYSIDTCAEVYVEALGGAVGKYYVEEVTYRVSTDSARRCALSMVRSGSWVL